MLGSIGPLMLVLLAGTAPASVQYDVDTTKPSRWKGIPIAAACENISNQEDVYACTIHDPATEVERWYVERMKEEGWNVGAHQNLNPAPGPWRALVERRFQKSLDRFTILFYDGGSKTLVTILRRAE